jgi:hypothetical protein
MEMIIITAYIGPEGGSQSTGSRVGYNNAWRLSSAIYERVACDVAVMAATASTPMGAKRHRRQRRGGEEGEEERGRERERERERGRARRGIEGGGDEVFNAPGWNPQGLWIAFQASALASGHYHLPLSAPLPSHPWRRSGPGVGWNENRPFSLVFRRRDDVWTVEGLS